MEGSTKAHVHWLSMICLFKSLETLKGKTLAKFVAEHAIDFGDKINYITSTSWKLYFNGLACRKGQGVSKVIISPNGTEFEMSKRLN